MTLEAYINEIYSEEVGKGKIGRCKGKLEEVEGSNRLKCKRAYMFNLPNKYDFNGKKFYIVNVLRLLSGGGFGRTPNAGEIYTNCIFESFKTAELDSYNGDRAIRIEDAVIVYEKKIRGYGIVDDLRTMEDLKEIIEDHLKMTKICKDCGEEHLLNDDNLPEKNCGFCTKCLLKEENIKIVKDRIEKWKAIEEKRKKQMEVFTQPTVKSCLPRYDENGNYIKED